MLKLAEQKTITAEGVVLVQKDADGEVHGDAAGCFSVSGMTAGGGAAARPRDPTGGYGVPRPYKGTGWARRARTGGWGTASVPPIS